MMQRTAAHRGEQGTVTGLAKEPAGVTHAELCEVFGADLRSRERLMMKTGLASQESMYFIPTDAATKATLSFPPDSALDLD